MSADNDLPANALEKPSDLGKTPESVARRWKLEIRLANKRESDWRKKAKDIYKIYAPENPVANSFNILWTNTETLRRACYNSMPQPQAKRRYSSDDPLGKNVSEVLERSLEFSIDTYDFDKVIKDDVLAMLLPGRAVSRIRYVPDIRTVGGEDSAADDDAQEGAYEEIEWEQVVAERVQYDDFRILCAAKTWDEVNAIGFRHRLTREECVEKFGEDIGNKINLDDVEDEDINKSKDADLFKTAEVWEVWDKEGKQVVWVAPSYPQPCKVQPDPLGLCCFFPIPRPLYAIENNTTLVPTPLYTQYEQQAKELNRVSRRINKLVDALKLRGIYDATLSELSELMKGEDNDLIPAQNVTALLERGGIEKAIWMMPIDTAAMVLKELYNQRESTKQVIYEITGISDIMRSASDPNETYGAQKIKTQWGTQRLQKMQKEVQRYIRDLLRLKAEIIAEKFQVETLEQMTLVQLPHQAEVDQQNQMMMQQYQQQAQQAQMQGQQPPPPPQPQNPITWEQVVEAMRQDATRTYHVDIETDSTLSASQDADMEGLKEVLMGVTQLVQGFGPAVQMGAIPIEAVKEIMLAVVRRARMGSAVEDSLNKMQAPQQQPDPNQVKMQAEMQMQEKQQQHEKEIEQFKAQLQDQQHQRELEANAMAEQQKAQLQAQLQQHEQDVQAHQIQHQNELEAQREQLRMQLQAEAEARKHEYEQIMLDRQNAFDKWKTEFTESTKILIAQIGSQSALDQAALSAQQSADEEVNENLGGMEDLIEMHGQTLNAINGVMQHLARPKKTTIMRDDEGKAIGAVQE